MSTEDNIEVVEDRDPQPLVAVAVLAAGQGSRFSEDARYADTHKTLIPVFDERMSIFSYKNTVNNLSNLSFAPVFVTSNIVTELDPNLQEAIYEVVPKSDGARIYVQNGYVNGPAETSKFLANLVRPIDPILFVNADQYIVGTYTEAILEVLGDETLDGALFCFNSTEDRYSYVTVDEDMIATSMIEKVVTGDKASAGICFWKQSSDYFEALETVEKPVEEEVFISDVHAAAITNGKKFKVFMVDTFIDLGTPDDLDLLEERWEAISE
jgi:dTDP-glucose pyrophosphorylase